MYTLARPRATSAIVPRASSSRARASSRRACVARAEKQSVIDGVIDMLEGGRKLRRWYGSDSSVGDGTRVDDDPVDDGLDGTSEEDERDVELDTPKTAVLVTDAVGGVGEASSCDWSWPRRPSWRAWMETESRSRRRGSGRT